jgi:hypothetical protein
MHRSNETRPLLAAISRLAERYHFAPVAIRHPGKPGQGDIKAIHRGLGSIDFMAAARTALFAESHPTEADKALLAQSKSNIGRLGRTQVYSKADGLFTWCGVSRLTAEMVAGSGRGPDRHTFLEVACWLEAYLTPGIPKLSADIEKAAEQEGYNWKTVQRAKKALGMVSIKDGDIWRWKLPELSIMALQAQSCEIPG